MGLIFRENGEVCNRRRIHKVATYHRVPRKLGNVVRIGQRLMKNRYQTAPLSLTDEDRAVGLGECRKTLCELNWHRSIKAY
jgi:hypothetical protein